ncbi:3063_t:CDS:2 [Cetraspora pellucida]|uniref:3063_t:CDS:1 n=1 Tax=Cetraspora pellucida TaxID=1433469 RepID=A0A9N9FC20_9GLOM|nr:3063_t:CDS:2 [Cetraspora pellucida]
MLAKVKNITKSKVVKKTSPKLTEKDCHDAIEDALKELANTDNLNVNAAAAKFGISETTLRRAVKNSYHNHHGPTTILSSYEKEQLVGYCKNMQRLGFGLTKSGVNHCVMEILKNNKRNHPFNNKGLSRTWWDRFMKDHSDLSFRMPQALSEACAQRANPVIINDHFKKLKKIIQEYLLIPDCIWNMNETGFVISPKIQKVLTIKGARQVYKVSHRNIHDYISVVPMISAAGDYIPPLIIYKDICTISGLLAGAPSGSVIGFTDSGYMREDLFQMYIEHFISLILSARPVLLMLDGHKSHVNYTSVKFCYDNEVLLYALPSHTTHMLQPSEIPFTKLKNEYSNSCDKLHNDKGEVVTKHTFASILEPAFATTYTFEAITNSFRVTGIWPFNPNVISLDHLDPSLTTEQPDLLPSFQPIQPTEEETPMLAIVFSLRPTQKYSTRAATVQELKLLKEEINSLKNEVESLKKENESIKKDLTSVKKELEMYKRPELEKMEELARSKAKNAKKKKEAAAEK